VAFESLKVLSTCRHGKSHLREAWCFEVLELAQTLVLVSGDNNDRRLAVLCHRLRFASGGLDADQTANPMGRGVLASLSC
jgi:hypothetical protein